MHRPFFLALERGIEPYFDTDSAGLQSDRRLVWQKLQRLGPVDDKVFELYPLKGKKGGGDEESRED